MVLAILAVQFVAFYTSKGWKIGSDPMKCWKSAVVGWYTRYKQEHPEWKPPQPKPSAEDEKAHREKFDKLTQQGIDEGLTLPEARRRAHEKMRE